MIKNFFNKIRFFFLCLNLTLKGGEEDMVYVYVTLIVAGRRTFKQVPTTVKEEVKNELIAMELSKLVEE